MRRRFIELLIVFVGFLCVGSNGIYYHGGVNPTVNQCKESEQNALLNLKQGFNNASAGLLSSWVAEDDCCKWRGGVLCSSRTGHVVALDLRSSSPREALQGELSTSLADLHYLSYLDLSLNDFHQTQVPEFLCSLGHLKYLNLSHANFKGSIPDCLGNLSRLQYLDLSGNHFSLRVDNPDWLCGLSSLKVLDLGGVDLSRVGDRWLACVSRMHSLVKLSLFYCQLKKLPSSLPNVNFTSLEYLDLSFNSFYAPIPRWFFNKTLGLVHLNLSRTQMVGSIPRSFGSMTSLSALDLSNNSLSGPIPHSFGSMTSLTTLDLSVNILNGSIPVSLGNLTHLTVLDLSHNQLNGPLEQSLAQLSQLVVLDISSNSFTGIVTEAQLVNFGELRVLELSSNSFVFNISPHWVPAFRLDTIGLRSCILGPQFPEWLQTQNDFLSVDISNGSISGTVPSWFWDLSVKAEHIDLSFNSLEGELPNLSSKFHLSVIDLSYNLFQGPLPHFTDHIVSLMLANNKLSGSLFSLCEILVPGNSLSFLDLSSNVFSGRLPDCWRYGDSLVVLNVANNSLDGTIPYSIGHLVHLKALRLGTNRFSGEVPHPLKNCTGLYIMDLQRNHLSGTIPSWIGDSMVNLMILKLRYNEFKGSIPFQLCQLKSLLILDLGSNALSGQIPRCINNFLTMALVEEVHSYAYDPFTAYKTDLLDTLLSVDHMESNLVWKGMEVTFRKTMALYVKAIDLSDNVLSGEIPREVTSLVGLHSLNLSRNNLRGTIPPDIGALTQLDALDLSRNRLSCSIPASANLMHFVDLNLSYNDFSGSVPTNGVLQTFDANVYYGNQKLCGFRLPNKCLEDASDDPHCSSQPYLKEEVHEESDMSFLMSMGIGFMTGFWVFWGTLAVKRSWRYAYFQFLENMTDKVYVITAINIARLQRKLQINQQQT